MNTKRLNRILNLVVIVALALSWLPVTTLVTAAALPSGPAAQNLSVETLLNSNGTLNTQTGRAEAAPSLASTAISPFSRVGSLQLNDTESETPAAVIDSAHGYAYYGSRNGYNSPGIILKVRLTDFTKVAELRLNSDETDLNSAVIDPAAGFAYFGTRTNPAKIIKINLNSFTRAGVLTLGANETNLDAAMIDTAGGYAYFASNDSSNVNKAYKINLATFTRVGTLNFFCGFPSCYENTPHSGLIDTAKHLAYFVMQSYPCRIVKVDLTTFTRLNVLTLNAGENNCSSASIDTTNGFLYTAATNDDATLGIIVKVNLATFKRAGALTLAASGESWADTQVIDAAHAMLYFTTGDFATAVKVVKVNLAGFTRVSDLTIASNLGPYSGLLDPAAGNLYFSYRSNATALGGVTRVRISDFTSTGTLTFDAAKGPVLGGVIDPAGGVAYFPASTSPASVSMVNLASFSMANVTMMASGQNLMSCGVIDPTGGYSYFANDTFWTTGNPNILARYNLATHAIDSTLTINPAGNAVVSAPLIDTVHHYAYFAIDTTVYRYNLTTFTAAGSLSINVGKDYGDNGEDPTIAAVIDPVGGYAYYAVNHNYANARVVKVKLANFTVAGSFDLIADDGIYPRSAVIDTAGGLAYFAIDPSDYLPYTPARIVKVDLKTFTRTARAVLNAGEYRPIAAAIAPAAGYAYFGTYTNPGYVVRVRLSNMARVDALTLPDGEDTLTSAVTDLTHGYAYFSTNAVPAYIVKIDLGITKIYKTYLPSVGR